MAFDKVNLEELAESVFSSSKSFSEHQGLIIEKKTTVFDPNTLKLDSISTNIGSSNVSVLDILKLIDSVDDSEHAIGTLAMRDVIKNSGITKNRQDIDKFIEKMFQYGWLTSKTGRPNAKKLILTDKSIQALFKAETGVEVDKAKAKQLDKSIIDRQLKATKKIKYKLPANVKNTKTETLVKFMISDMMTKLSGTGKSYIMITGKPGVGKTQTINQVAKLFGMSLIVFEAPHLIEENLISIPYIVFDTEGKEKSDTMQIEGSEASGFKLLNAESNAVTAIKKLKPIKESVWENMIKTNKPLKILFNKFGSLIKQVRTNGVGDKKGFSKILFIDEYYRRNSDKIGNILRGILNGEIGDDPIPSDTYVIFASNIEDEGGTVATALSHEQFQEVQFDDVDKDSFMTFIADKYTDVDVETKEESGDKIPDITIDPDLYNALSDSLPNIIGSDRDEDEGPRISPRKAEQLVLMANKLVEKVIDDPSSTRDISAMYTMILNNFIDPDYGTVNSEDFSAFDNAIKSALKSKGYDISLLKPLPKTEFRAQLENFIDLKQDYKDKITVTPVLSSEPGQGKTATIKALAKDKNMGMVYIEMANQSKDSVIGLPLPNERGDTVEVEFSAPPLYRKIMKEYEKQRKDHYEEGRQYNVILFLDELSRVEEPAVFNAFRMMLLDHKVTTGYELPDDLMIVSAMNPAGEGTSTISEHVKDVLTVIPSVMSFSKFTNFLDTETPDLFANVFKVGPIVRNILSDTATRLASDRSNEGRELDTFEKFYYWIVSPETNEVVYLAPRVLSDFYFKSLPLIQINLAMEGIDITNLGSLEVTNALIKKATSIISDSILESFDTNTVQVARGQGIDDMSAVKDVLESTIIDHYDDFTNIFAIDSTEVIKTLSLTSIFDSLDFTDPNLEDTLGGSDIVDAYNTFIEQSDSNASIIKDFAEAFTVLVNKVGDSAKNVIKSAITIYNVILSDDSPIKGVSEGDITQMKRIFKTRIVDVLSSITGESDVTDMVVELSMDDSLDANLIDTFFNIIITIGEESE